MTHSHLTAGSWLVSGDQKPSSDEGPFGSLQTTNVSSPSGILLSMKGDRQHPLTPGSSAVQTAIPPDGGFLAGVWRPLTSVRFRPFGRQPDFINDSLRSLHRSVTSPRRLLPGGQLDGWGCTFECRSELVMPPS